MIRQEIYAMLCCYQADPYPDQPTPPETPAWTLPASPYYYPRPATGSAGRISDSGCLFPLTALAAAVADLAFEITLRPQSRAQAPRPPLTNRKTKRPGRPVQKPGSPARPPS